MDVSLSLFHPFFFSLFFGGCMMMEFSQTRRYLTLVCLVMVSLAGGLAGVRSEQHMVKMTLVAGATKMEAVCLDGSLPGYHLDRGFGAGVDNWLLQFEGGGWCNDVKSCLERAGTYRGSTTYKNKWAVFSGILSNKKSENPVFFNWNRVKLRYCDGASFAGDSEFHNGTTTLYFRGERIWEAFMLDLLPKGLNLAQKALLSGSSAGGLATFLHCDKFTNLLPKTATVKCLSDAGFFLDVEDVSGSNTIRPFFKSLVDLQRVEKNLDRRCTGSLQNPTLCFFPQYALQYIQTPYFILNSAYDTYQFNHIFVPPSTDPRGQWLHCKRNLTKCTKEQLDELQVFRVKMLAALQPLRGSNDGGLFINSCSTHGQSEVQDAWFAPYSPRLNNKTIAVVVGDWYFGRNVYKEVDCQYPCNNACIELTNP